ncbi:hypothetical protein SAMN04487928_14034 [Butyrivibrio proteoclasticus]|uniref:Uncharacterized protein n=1 Tax=Butyrivibrio proteoclasticus TaxID=43305 RepID=A0A1I5Y3Z1_9FIRM|nr:hypothetical protein [Butyrivibrio proteoclasticus]SFQ38941.1 hypothetical protein SAMN04487928_14034 [Butyrivibrio proteoclasticus]
MGKIEVRGNAARTVDYDRMKVEINFHSVEISPTAASEKSMKECEEALASSRQFLDSLLTDDEYCEMSKKSAKAQKELVSENNQFLIVRDKDWEHIYGMIEKDSGSFGRFYSIMRTDMSNRDLNYMGVVLLINDDFWNYTVELAAGLENDD